MRAERWLNGWRSRGVLLCAAGLFVLYVISFTLGAVGQCEYWGYDDGTSLPINYPWHPTTTAGREMLMQFISVMSITWALSEPLVLMLLMGALWGRAMRSAPLVLALILVPGLALLLCFPELIVHFTVRDSSAEPSLALQLTWETAFLRRDLTKVSLWLVALGLGALGIRALLALRPRRRPSA